MKDRIAPLTLAAAGALLTVGVLTFAGPCVHDDGSAATCVLAAHAVLAAGAVALAVGLATAALRNLQVDMVLAAVGIAAGVFAAVAPGGLFGLCMMQTMRCWIVMQPFSIVMGVVIAAISALLLARALARRRSARRAVRRMAR